MNTEPSLKDIYAIFTKCPVLLPLQREKKISYESGWPEFTWETTQDPHYQWRLGRAINIGILSGKASNNLIFFDWDTQAGLEWFLENNPRFKNGFAVTGRGFGGQVAGYCEGEYPANTVFHLPPDHPLAAGAKPGEGDTVQVGSFRGDRLQSVLVGIHPDTKKHYSWLLDNPPITFRFEEVKWHPDLHLPWTETHAAGSSNGNESFDWMTQTVTIDFLWKYFGFKPRAGNPGPSPFRDDNNVNHPSFSVHIDSKTGKQIFKDFYDQYPDHKGDSYKFYQLASGLDSKAAYKPFETLAYAILNGEPIPPYGQPTEEPELYIPPVRETPKVAPIGEAAYHGFIGEWVRCVEPQIESNLDNLLVQMVTVTGIVLGRRFYTFAGQDLFTNLLTVILGPTGARKGTALYPIKKFYEEAAPDWQGARDNWKSGEALVHFTRDPVWKSGKLKDEGINDKRVLVEETELIHLFKTAERQGNTLTDMLRKAWDSPERFCNTSKGSAETATRAHIGSIGHMTNEEFLLVDPSLIDSGLISRFNWGGAFRARVLPDVQPVVWPDLLLEWFRDIYAYAYGGPEVNVSELGGASFKPIHVPLDANAQLLWNKVYGTLTIVGTLGKVLERVLLQARKIALIYAICDKSAKITRIHLEAGLAIANHSKANAIEIFQGFGPNKIANRLLAALKLNPEGLDLTKIHKHVFNNKVSGHEIHEAIVELTRNQLIFTRGHEPGKRNTIWRVV